MIFHYLFPGLWTAAGLVGFVLRVWLLRKFLSDLYFSAKNKLNGLRLLVVYRAAENCILHLLIKCGIIIVGVSALLTPPGPVPSRTEIILTTLLVFIPVGLAVDAARECAFQLRLLHDRAY